jgi:hypothetical protein
MIEPPIKKPAFLLILSMSLLISGCSGSENKDMGSASSGNTSPEPSSEGDVSRTYLQFDGMTHYVEVPDSADFSVGAAGLTIAVWMRPDALTFPKTEGSLSDEQYVHWLGKGETGQQEWTFRMYSQTTPPGPRANRISFYLFNLAGGLGVGSYFQDPVDLGKWIQVAGVVDEGTKLISIYKNGSLRDSTSYGGTITPSHGTAPLRIGTRDFASYLQGAVGEVRIWNRPLTEAEVRDLYATDVIPQNGLMAQYLLNEGTGHIVHDTSGNAHNGTVSGAAWKINGHEKD